uniref:Uncharacterized protein n=1 Tax=Lactuca sativa TaxID=4236 RepID=A0A9R1VMV5_LACSA|nr:hypothetical protein LSAT_V11C500253420 [Lactuca sativa]
MEPPIVETFSEALGGSGHSDGSGYSSDSDNRDSIVDEDNLLDDPKVDMHDFYLNIHDNLEWFGYTYITTENVINDAAQVSGPFKILQTFSSS